MSSDQFNIDHPHGHKTRDGRGVKIINTEYEFDGGETIVALIDEGGSVPTLQTYFSNGRRFEEDEVSDFDLINVPAPKRTFKRWYVLARWDDGSIHEYSFGSKDAADDCANTVRTVIERHEREAVEGTGLDDSNMQNMQSAPEPEEQKTVKVDCWLNIDEDGDIELWLQRVQADEWKNRNRIACIHIERDVKVGEGLDD